VILTEEQQESLTTLHPDTFKTFALNEQQKSILAALAPLTREDKYSEDSLDLFFKEKKVDEKGNIIRTNP